MNLSVRQKYKFLQITALVIGIMFVNGGSYGAETSAEKIKITKGSKTEVCQQIYKILQLPENSDYLMPPTIPATVDRPGVFSVPETYTDFRVPVWQDTTFDEYKQALPEEAVKIEKFLVGGADTLQKVQKIEMDPFNSGTTSTVYKLAIKSNHPKFGVPYFESSDIVDSDYGRARYFHDEASEAYPINYKGTVLLSMHPDNSVLRIFKFTDKKRVLNRSMLCDFKVERVQASTKTK